MPRLILIGAGGHGKVAADTANASNWNDLAFLDQAFPKRKTNAKWPIIDNSSNLKKHISNDTKCFTALGNNVLREEMCQKIPQSQMINLIHPEASFSVNAEIGTGVLIVAGSVVNIDAEIGDGVILNTGCTVDHDCRIGAFAHISPGANLAGNVSVGARSWIGIGAAIREGITIGKDVKVAAGSVVVSDIPDGSTVMGVPAKIVSKT